MDSQQLNFRLLDRIEDVIYHLFPNAVIKKGEAMVGDISGVAGESLKIVLRGAKAGTWKDFATDQRGRTLTSLWCEARAKDCRKAFEEMHAYLGIKRMNGDNFYPARRERKAIKVEDAVAVVDGSQTMGYLVSERGITPATLKAYRVAQSLKDDVMVFPSFEPDGKTLVHAKYLAIKRDEEGKKRSWTTKDTACVLFGKQAVPMNGDDLVITEGEIDAMSMYQMGYPAVSIPFGAGNHDKWIESDYEWLECFSRIILCMDADGAGYKGRNQIAKRLGHHRCFVVTMPEGCKDANDVLLAEREADMFEAMEAVATIDPPQLKPASEFWEETREVRYPTRTDAAGVPFLFGAPWSIRPREITIWMGYNFHGKSLLLNQAMVYFRSLGQTTCIASFEVEPPVTLDIMTGQALGRQPFTADEKDYKFVFDWLTEGMLIVNRVGIIPWRELLDIMRYAALRYRVKQFVVDSMLRCGIAQDDFQGQKDFIDACTIFSLENDCHVHVVAHAKKPQSSDESRPPSKYDIKGSGDISDLAHNVVCVHRNMDKQEKKERLKGAMDAETLRMPDGTFLIYKQRRTGRIAKLDLFHLGSTSQFQNMWDAASQRYAPEYTLI